ncbi:MCE family protein [Solihabitans fulvus]|uniref:MCE family protein n=1 Tax=Solihabitans fulvus TaxID=1892852 RepID=A0A5B2WJD7_9PSEU|nr:MCE family protein [Solihabitans fulvus]KAA2250177.1 MCE family protein [Solihabitans fulvus]
MRRLALALLAVLAVAGCGPFGGAYNLPLPGGADLGGHPYVVRAQFRNVLDLVPQAGVKVNDVTVGKVTAITLLHGPWTAEVTLAVNGDVRLPATASAALRQSSLLGEKYVELVAPPDGAGQPPLADGAVIPVERTSRSVEVEEVFGALSMLLNGGGVQQLQDISRELSTVSSGNESQLRTLLATVTDFAGRLDAHRGDITRALDGLNRLAATLDGQKDAFAHVLDTIGPGLDVLDQQRGQLVDMLRALENLSGVAVDTVRRSKDDLVADLTALTPTLRKLAEAGANLPASLQLLFTFPFTDFGAKSLRGDFVNMYIKFDLGSLVSNLLPDPAAPQPGVPQPGAPPTTDSPTTEQPTTEPPATGDAPPLPLPTTEPPITSTTPPVGTTTVQPSTGQPPSSEQPPSSSPTPPPGSSAPPSTTGSG